MKQTRRKELKTNELGLYLKQIQQSVTQYSNYIMGGIVVVVLVLMVGLYVRSSRHAAEAGRWAEYREIQRQDNTEIKPDLLERASRLANEAGGDPRLGPLSLELYCDLLNQRALQMSPLNAADEQAKLLGEARDGYQKLIGEYGDRKDIVARAHLNLAAVLESLAVLGKGSADAAREQYKLVIDGNTPGYADLAKSKLDTLSARTQPLKIVATRPAASQPASAPAPATRAASRPSITVNPPPVPRR